MKTQSKLSNYLMFTMKHITKRDTFLPNLTPWLALFLSFAIYVNYFDNSLVWYSLELKQAFGDLLLVLLPAAGLFTIVNVQPKKMSVSKVLLAGLSVILSIALCLLAIYTISIIHPSWLGLVFSSLFLALAPFIYYSFFDLYLSLTQTSEI